MTNGVLGARSIRVNVLDSTQHSASTAWRAIERRERRVGIVAIGGVQGIIRCKATDWIEDVVVGSYFSEKPGSASAGMTEKSSGSRRRKTTPWRSSRDQNSQRIQPTLCLENSAGGSETVPENVFSSPSELSDCKVQSQATTPLRPLDIVALMNVALETKEWISAQVLNR